ncbi:MAG: DMT family transporter [Alphaproteobacteria bacterium]|nr:DMT family transporter [Alphaproteobacteria bacterium]
MGATEWTLLILLSVLWGGVFLLNAIALTALGPLTIALGRVGLAALVLTAVLPLIGVRLPTAFRIWGAFLIMGALNNALPFTLIVWGQTYIDSGLAAILNATTPIFTVLIAHAATRDERLTPGRLAGVGLGFCGVAVLIGDQAVAGWSWHNIGQVAVLGAALSYACAGIYGRRFHGLSPVVAATGMLWGSTLLLAPVALWVEMPWQVAPSAEAWGAVIGLAVAGSAAAYVIYFRLLAVAGATNLLLVTFLLPVIAAVLGYIVLDERLGWNAWVGLALILGGLAAIDGRLIGKITRPCHAKQY